ncbi:hypothetical protein P9112_009741 [Eukaryota sp. TZLM1-RC]
MSTIIHTYPLDNYVMSLRDPVPIQDATMDNFLERLQSDVQNYGPRISVGAIFLTHIHKYPHILLLHSPGPRGFLLPGGRLDPGEGETDGLKRQLSTKLNPNLSIHWDIGEHAGTFYRPELGPRMLPFLPPHVSSAKETLKVYLVQLPPTAEFIQAKNNKLVAVPLHELYNDKERYGYLSEIPCLLSRISIVSS